MGRNFFPELVCVMNKRNEVWKRKRVRSGGRGGIHKRVGDKGRGVTWGTHRNSRA